MKRVVRSSLLFILALALTAPPLRADGFGIYTNGARATGMGGAWVARVMDPSAIFYNPAGMNQLAGTQLYVGAMGLLNAGNSVTFFDGTEFEQNTKFFVVPHLYLTHEFSDAFAAGIGVFTPYGLGTEWDEETFPGRFRSYDADLKSFYVQPSAAWAPVEAFSIGGGVDFVYADVELNRQSDLSTLVLPGTPGTTFGQVLGIVPNTIGFLDSSLSASGSGIGFNVGILIRPTPVVQLGFNYRSQVEIDLEGDVDFEPLSTGITVPAGNPFGVPAGTPLDAVLAPGLPVDQEATTTLILPDVVVGGISIAPTPEWMVNADVKWTNWEDFDELVIDFQNDNPGTDIIDPRYENGTSWRIGTELFVTPSVALRLGYIRDENPVPQRSVTPLLPDADRNELSAGIGYTTGAYQIDAFLLGEFFKDRQGPVGVEDDIPDGVYETKGILFGLDIGYRF